MSRRQRRPRRTSAAKEFWGPSGPPPNAAVRRIHPTADPGAVPRSLGDPPMSSDTAPQERLAIVYEEAVRAAVALAAANGLLDHDLAAVVGDPAGDEGEPSPR